MGFITREWFGRHSDNPLPPTVIDLQRPPILLQIGRILAWTLPNQILPS